MNQLLETTENALNEVVRVLGALSQGDLTQTITNNYSGTFGKLKNNSNTTVEKLKASRAPRGLKRGEALLNELPHCRASNSHFGNHLKSIR